MGKKLDEVIKTIHKLRDPKDGCPWDKKQTHESLLKYFIEEVYEYIYAVESKDINKMKEELGDVLLQIILHAKIEEEKGNFDLEDVANTLNEKMIRRHPHVFKDKNIASSEEEVSKNWSEIKRSEKKGGPFFTTEDLSLPALMSAQKIGKKSKEVNFDWDNIQDVFKKVEEELEETRVELLDPVKNRENVFEEIGDLLFSTVQLARHMGFEAHECLRFSNKKFVRRFEVLEKLIHQDKKDIKLLNIPELEAYWQVAKKKLKNT